MQQLLRSSPIATAAAVLAVGLLLTPAGGVVIVTGDGSGNTDDGGDPVFGDAFGNVQRLGSGAAVYLGNNFAIRPKHILGGGANFVFGQNVIAEQQFHELGNPSTLVDLVLIELEGNPGLPAFPIRIGTPPVATDVRMIGFGANREANVTYWNVTGGYPGDPPPDWVWNETLVPAEAELSGYEPDTSMGSPVPGDKQWGTNVVESIDEDALIDGGLLRVFRTEFTETGGTLHEAQGVGHDSGGAVVVFDATHGRWELAGLMHTIDVAFNQPGVPFSAVFGNETLASDLAAYRPQILPSIPEPSTLCLTLGAALVLLRRRRHEPSARRSRSTT